MQSHAPVYAQKAIKSLPFIVRWLNNLHILPRELTPKTIFHELSNGLILLAICELMLDVQFDRFERKPIARRACLNNIELALSVVWKKNVCSSHMCTAEDFYTRAPQEVTSCLMEIMEVATFREVRSHARRMMEDFDAVLCEHNRALCETTCTQPTQSVESLVRDFSSGIRVVVLLVRRGVVEERFLYDMIGKPESQEEYLNNLAIMLKALESGEIPVYLTAREFLSPPIPCPESLLLQLHEIWRAAFDEESCDVAIRADVRFTDGILITLEAPVKMAPTKTAQQSSNSFQAIADNARGSPQCGRARPDPSQNKTLWPAPRGPGTKAVAPPTSEAQGGAREGHEYSVATALAFLGHTATIADLHESLSLPSLRNHLLQHRLSPARMEEIAHAIKDEHDEVDMTDFARRCNTLMPSSHTSTDSVAPSPQVDSKARASRSGNTNTALRDDSREVATTRETGKRPAVVRTTDEEPTVQIAGASVQFNNGVVIPDCIIWSEVILCNSQWLHTVNFADSTMSTFLQLDTGHIDVPRSGCFEVSHAGIVRAQNTACAKVPSDAYRTKESGKLTIQLRDAPQIYNFSEEIRILAHFIRQSQA